MTDTPNTSIPKSLASYLTPEGTLPTEVKTTQGSIPTVTTSTGTIPTTQAFIENITTTPQTTIQPIVQNATPLPQKLIDEVKQPQEKSPDKQVKTGLQFPNVNPTGKGGFKEHPELINKNGRPKRKTITEYIIDELDKKLPSGITGHENMARLIISMAFGKRDKNGKIILKQDKDIVKEMWHYLDGMPKQKLEHTGADDEPLQVEIIPFKEKKDD